MAIVVFVCLFFCKHGLVLRFVFRVGLLPAQKIVQNAGVDTSTTLVDTSTTLAWILWCPLFVRSICFTACVALLLLKGIYRWTCFVGTYPNATLANRIFEAQAGRIYSMSHEDHASDKDPMGIPLVLGASSWKAKRKTLFLAGPPRKRHAHTGVLL